MWATGVWRCLSKSAIHQRLIYTKHSYVICTTHTKHKIFIYAIHQTLISEIRHTQNTHVSSWKHSRVVSQTHVSWRTRIGAMSVFVSWRTRIGAMSVFDTRICTRPMILARGLRFRVSVLMHRYSQKGTAVPRKSAGVPQKRWRTRIRGNISLWYTDLYTHLYSHLYTHLYPHLYSLAHTYTHTHTDTHTCTRP